MPYTTTFIGTEAYTYRMKFIGIWYCEWNREVEDSDGVDKIVACEIFSYA